MGVAVVATTLVWTLVACSDDGGDNSSDPGSPGSTATDTVTTNAAIGKVEGRLAKADRDEVVADVMAVVDGWIDAGYGGDYPRTDFDAAFADFTPDAKGLAGKQPKVMSNAAIAGDLTGVEITQRSLRVDVVAPKGKVAGATARIRITLEVQGDATSTEQVAGRLLLTPAKGGWKVFGFDVSRNEMGA